MKIQWTPWNVPMHRRLEVMSAAFAMFVALALGPISAILMLYFLVRWQPRNDSVSENEFHTQFSRWNIDSRKHLYKNHMRTVCGLHLLWSSHRWQRRSRCRVRNDTAHFIEIRQTNNCLTFIYRRIFFLASNGSERWQYGNITWIISQPIWWKQSICQPIATIWFASFRTAFWGKCLNRRNTILEQMNSPIWFPCFEKEQRSSVNLSFWNSHQLYRFMIFL